MILEPYEVDSKTNEITAVPALIKHMAVQGIEKRTVSITQQLDGIPDFPGLKTLIRVDAERHVDRANIIEASQETRYYVASFVDTAEAFAESITVHCNDRTVIPAGGNAKGSVPNRALIRFNL